MCESLSVPCSHKQLEQLEVKKSSLKKELMLVKEALNKATLEKEVSENEKVEMAEALSKVGLCAPRGSRGLGGRGQVLQWGSGVAVGLAGMGASDG